MKNFHDQLYRLLNILEVMGNIPLKCDFCDETSDENNDPILKIFSNGKHSGKYVCWSCLKEKIEKILIVEERVRPIDRYTKP